MKTSIFCSVLDLVTDAYLRRRMHSPVRMSSLRVSALNAHLVIPINSTLERFSHSVNCGGQDIYESSKDSKNDLLYRIATSPPAAGTVLPLPHDWPQSCHSRQDQQSFWPISAPCETPWPTNATAALRPSTTSRRKVRRCRSRGPRRGPFRRYRSVWCW